MEKKGNLIFPPVEDVPEDSTKNNVGQNNGNDCDKNDNNGDKKTNNGGKNHRGGWTRWD